VAAEPQADFTDILIAWRAGDDTALPRLTAIVYDELHRLARYYMARERPDHTLQATALVNEAYLKLVDSSRVRWQNRAHFMAVAAQSMRRILVDFARQRNVQKRGGGANPISLHEGLIVGSDPSSDLVALDDALQDLAKMDARKSQVVEMRFFGGLSLADTAEALGVSEDTVGRDWTAAKAWLLRELTRGAHRSDTATTDSR
jgi:RNA polymerase sigma factor (TIGR02999 family)